MERGVSRLDRTRLRNILILLGILLAYALFTGLTGLGIPCLFHAVTGLNCPGCGGTRMITALLKLDIRSAFEANRVLFCLLPLIVLLVVYLVLKYLRKKEATSFFRKAESWYAGVLCVILLGWGVVRNILQM